MVPARGASSASSSTSGTRDSRSKPSAESKLAAPLLERLAPLDSTHAPPPSGANSAPLARSTGMLSLATSRRGAGEKDWAAAATAAAWRSSPVWPRTYDQ